MRVFLGLLVIVLLAGSVWGHFASQGAFGIRQEGGEIAAVARDSSVIAQRAQRVAEGRRLVEAPGDKQILFGDLHVHTTFSFDAFSIGLPMSQGEGSHPPADACDFARFCSGLDFWSINDHAESLTSHHWTETKETVRRCNEAAGAPANPDMVTFLGWEWTQIGTEPENHYGHKNVVLRDTADDVVPVRPIASRNQLFENLDCQKLS